MRNGKMTCVRKMTSREILLGLIVPFILFWGGVLTPVFIDSLMVWVCCLVPFYGFVIISDNVLRDRIDRGTFVFSIFLGLLSSIFLFLLLILFPFENEVYRIVCRIGFMNILPSIFFLIMGGIDNIRWFGCGYPIFMNNNSL
ncbi:hypothetical protein [Fibrobacter sp. UWEL]|uniref:hypothetical protein n=1 Tax=Fibrobacter sp. UWEL TaxID=1896209 RepID=UPI001160C381|nr:hypothetical protein [Fibrobacter sp. UWEL]